MGLRDKGEKTRSTLSAVIITYNEERNIRDCLESIKWVDEIVVVDAYSSDRTVEIAREYTDKVYRHPWLGYGGQKNFGINQATSDWVLIVDADERVTEELRHEIQATLQSPDEEAVGYEIPRKNYFHGQWMRWAGQYPDYQLRLFKRTYGRYDRRRIHEHLILTGEKKFLKKPLEHFSYQSISDYLRRLNVYTTLGAEEKFQIKKTIQQYYDLVIRPVSTFIKFYILKQGIREGIRGFILSILASFHTFMKYAKLWEIIHNKDPR